MIEENKFKFVIIVNGLFYYKNNSEIKDFDEKEYSGDIKEVIQEVLRAVIEVEDRGSYRSFGRVINLNLNFSKFMVNWLF